MPDSFKIQGAEIRLLSDGLGLGKITPKKLSLKKDEWQEYLHDSPSIVPLSLPPSSRARVGNPFAKILAPLIDIALVLLSSFLVCSAFFLSQASVLSLKEVLKSFQEVHLFLRAFSVKELLSFYILLHLSYFTIFKLLSGWTVGKILVKR